MWKKNVLSKLLKVVIQVYVASKSTFERFAHKDAAFKTKFFCTHYFWGTNRKATKTITEWCFSCQGLKRGSRKLHNRTHDRSWWNPRSRRTYLFPSVELCKSISIPSKTNALPLLTYQCLVHGQLTIKGLSITHHAICSVVIWNRFNKFYSFSVLNSSNLESSETDCY